MGAQTWSKRHSFINNKTFFLTGININLKVVFFFHLLQLCSDVFLLAAEPKGSPIVWDPAMWTRKGPRGSAGPPGPGWDPVRQHGWIVHGAGGCRRTRPHQGTFSPLPERPGVCYHGGGAPPEPLRPLSTARDQPSPVRLPGKPGHAGVVLHSHTASAPLLPLDSQPHASPHPNRGAAGGEGRVTQDGLAVTGGALRTLSGLAAAKACRSFRAGPRRRSSLPLPTESSLLTALKKYFAQTHS